MFKLILQRISIIIITLLIIFLSVSVVRAQNESVSPPCPVWDYNLFPPYPNARAYVPGVDMTGPNPFQANPNSPQFQSVCQLAAHTGDSSQDVFTWYQNTLEQKGFFSCPEKSSQVNGAPKGNVDSVDRIFQKKTDNNSYQIDIVSYVFTGSTGTNNTLDLTQETASESMCGIEPPKQTNACTLSPDDEQKRQEIITDISKRYKFKIVDTNMCEVKDCVNNTKWSVGDLEEIRKTLDSLPKCFTDKLNLEGIGGRIKVDQKKIDIFNPKVLFKESLQESCCSPDLLEDKGCYWGGTLPSVMTFCGDRYRNISPMCKKQSEKLNLTFDGLLVHEMTHAFQNQNIYLPPQAYDTLLVKSWNIVTGWVCFPLFGCKNLYVDKMPTTYAGVSPLEDMSESARLYYENPDELKKISPERYNFVKNNIMCGKEFSGNK